MYCIVGGAGFIGTRVCRLLEERGQPFEIVDLKMSRSFPNRTKIADIRDQDALRAAVTGDVVIHLAAVHRDDINDHALYYSTNVDGTRNLCALAEERGIRRMVFTSTVAVYGFAEPDTDENGALDPFNDYGRSKLQAEDVLRDWYARDHEKRTLAIIRPTVVFGEGNRGNVYNLLNQIARGHFVMVGKGTNRKSMAYVANIAEYLLFTAAHAQGETTVNYVDKPDFTMNELVKTVRGALTGEAHIGPRIPYPVGLTLGYAADAIARAMGRTLPISSIRVRKFCANTCFTSRAHDTPGFSAPVPLKEGLIRTLRAEFLEPDPEREFFYTE